MLKKIYSFPFLPLIISSLLFLVLQSRLFNLGLGFRDEGFFYLAASRILSGEIPYKDFFLTTTPGSYYLLALMIKLFGNLLIVNRIMYMVLVLVIFVLVDKLYQIRQIYKYVILLSMAVLFLGKGAIAFYNIEALILSLLAFFLLSRGLDGKNGKQVFFSGILVGLTVFFKQSYGVWLGVGFLIVILIERLSKFGLKDKFIGLYIAGGAVIALPYLIYLIISGSLTQFTYYTFIFSRTVKSHRGAFLFKSIVSIPFLFVFFKVVSTKKIKNFILKNLKFIFAFGLIIIVLVLYRFNTYFELTRLYYALFLILPVWAFTLQKNNSKGSVMVKRLSIMLLALFLASASSGREIGTVTWLSPVYFPLLVYIFDSPSTVRQGVKPRIVSIIILLFIVVQSILLSVNNLNYVFNQNEYSLNRIANTQMFGIKIKKSEQFEISKLDNFLKCYKASRKLLCFPYCPLANIIFEMKSPSYFSFFYNETFLPESQNSVIDNIEKNKSIIILQKKGDIEPEADYENKRLKLLKSYIVNQHQKVFEMENFTVYK